MAAEKYLLVEALNFDSTVFDTNQISIIRGSSLLALNAITAVAETVLAEPHKLISSGASKGLFHLAESADVPALVAKIEQLLYSKDKAAPYGYLTFGIEWCESGSFEIAREILNAKMRTAQLRQPTLLPDNYAGNDVCADTGVRASRGESRLHDDQELLPLSDSARARFDYGRDQRNKQYRTDIELAGATALLNSKFTADLQKLANCEAMGRMHNKLAIIYADGNRFSEIRKPADKENSLQREYRFDTALQKQRSEFRVSLLSSLSTESEEFQCTTIEGALRFETLLWGGDDMLFAVPAWLGIAALDHLLNYPWQFDGNPLTHSAGLVFCNVKTPIARTRALALEMVDSVKKDMPSPVNAFDYVVLESIDYPTEPFAGFLSRRYGTELANARPARLVPACKLASTRQSLEEIIHGDGLSASSVHTLATGIYEGQYPISGQCKDWCQAMYSDATEASGLCDVERRYIHMQESPKKTSENIAATFNWLGCTTTDLDSDVKRAWCWLHLQELWHYLQPAKTELKDTETADD